jgi:serine/threonine protein kinase
MTWIAINCPQCSAPLPRQAIWRTVKCPYCGAVVTKTESVVQRDTFRQALLRSRQDTAATGQSVLCGGQNYRLQEVLGTGELSKVYAALRTGPQPLLATVKLSSAPQAAARYAREALALRQLQALQSVGAAYFGQRIPQVLSLGAVETGRDGGQAGAYALVLRHPTGYWGSLAAVCSRYPQGLDARHSVWMWRRMLEVLGFVHAQGWCHGDVRPEHALVHSRDHGVRLIGWADAHAGASGHDCAQDVQHSARTIRVLLTGALAASGVPRSVPGPLADLLAHASDDTAFCQQHGALGIDTLLKAAALKAFGAPQFVPFEL